MELEKLGFYDLKFGEYDFVFGEYKFLFGNIEKYFFYFVQYNGFVVGVKGGRFLIIVNSYQYVCFNNQVIIRKYLWFYLVFIWKDLEFLGVYGFEIFVDLSRVFLKFNCVCYILNCMLFKCFKIGFNEGGLLIIVEFDYLVIWYKNFQVNNFIFIVFWVCVIGKIYFYFILVDWN